MALWRWRHYNAQLWSTVESHRASFVVDTYFQPREFTTTDQLRASLLQWPLVDRRTRQIDSENHDHATSDESPASASLATEQIDAPSAARFGNGAGLETPVGEVPLTLPLAGERGDCRVHLVGAYAALSDT